MNKFIAMAAILAASISCTKEIENQPTDDREALLKTFIGKFETKSGDSLSEEEKDYFLQICHDVSIIRFKSSKTLFASSDGQQNTKSNPGDIFVEFEDSLCFSDAPCDTLAEEDDATIVGVFGTLSPNARTDGSYEMYNNTAIFSFSPYSTETINYRHKVSGKIGETAINVESDGTEQTTMSIDNNGGPYSLEYTVRPYTRNAGCSYSITRI